MARHMRWFPWMLVTLALALAALTWASRYFYEAHQYRQQVVHDTLGTRSSAHVVFANAYYYASHGQHDRALAAYAAVSAMDDRVLRKAAYYNSGNLYLARATYLLESQGLSAWDEAGPLIALAKESYQKALRLQPSWSEAKYNYQLALRLAPSTYAMRAPKQYEDEDIKNNEDPTGWPAVPGNPRGMP